MSDTRNSPGDEPANIAGTTVLQAELREAREQIAALQGLMETMCNGMTDGIALFDADRRIVHINKAAQDFLGVGPVPAGMRGEEILLARQAAGDVAVVDGKMLSIDERMALIFAAEGSRFERALANGRHGEIVFRPLGEGQTLCVCRDITKHKRRQGDLEEARDEALKAHELMNAVLGSMRDGVALFSNDSILYGNPALARLFDFAGPFEPCGRKIVDALRMLEAAGDHMIEKGRAIPVEERARRILDGQPATYERELPSGRHIECRFERLADGRTVGHYRDITERKRRETELEQAHAETIGMRALLSEVLDNLTDGLVLFDGDQRLLYSNRALRDYFGVEAAASIQGKTLAELLEMQHAAGDRVFADGKPMSVEERLARIVDPEGGRAERVLRSGRHIERFYRPLSDGKRLGIYRDITDMKQRQVALERTLDRMEAGQHLMGVVLDAMPDGVGLLDGQKVLYANKMMSELFGYAGLIIQPGTTLSDVVRAQEATGDRIFVDGRPLTIEERVARALAPGGSRFERKLPSGRHVEFLFMPVGGGRTLCVYRDITALKQNQGELEKAQDEVAATRNLMSTSSRACPSALPSSTPSAD